MAALKQRLIAPFPRSRLRPAATKSKGSPAISVQLLPGSSCTEIAGEPLDLVAAGRRRDLGNGAINRCLRAAIGNDSRTFTSERCGNRVADSRGAARHKCEPVSESHIHES